MEIKVKTGNIRRTRADAIVLGVFEGIKRPRGDVSVINKALGGAISQLIQSGEIKGKSSEVTVIHSLGRITADRVALVGLGKRAELTQDKIRLAAAEVCRVLQKKGVKNAATVALGAGFGKITPQASARAVAEGAILGLYSFRKHMTKESNEGKLEELTIIERSRTALAGLKQGADGGKILAEATNTARDMVNEPSNFMTPTRLAEEAKSIAEKYGLEITVLEREDMQKLGMGALLGVAQGSHQPPKFVILKYKGASGKDVDIALIGKGITFDSGGISLKSPEGMGDMKGDMAGGASVIAAIGVIARMKPKINVMVIVAATENLPGGGAFKPADVLTAMNGKTIEIESTDAEGRLTLADALSYANKQGVKRIVDIATLTGGCVVALGDVTTGAFSNNQTLVDQVIAAGKETGDKIWQMPMYEEYKEQNKSETADIKNTGGRKASPITAALFVGEFAGETPWVHLDIAGTSMLDKARGYYGKGATGVPTRTLVQLVLGLAKEK
ncbi:MAG: leucyl aminopeptidase [Dehalococcoidia bacterium]|nr:leucyl aminopeptidase [Dehalococcoidia bacterium]